ncbi:glycerophosphoinositol permease [Pestalotiopsis sp. IQ-011]
MPNMTTTQPPARAPPKRREPSVGSGASTKDNDPYSSYVVEDITWKHRLWRRAGRCLPAGHASHGSKHPDRVVGE